KEGTSLRGRGRTEDQNHPGEEHHAQACHPEQQTPLSIVRVHGSSSPTTGWQPLGSDRSTWRASPGYPESIGKNRQRTLATIASVRRIGPTEPSQSLVSTSSWYQGVRHQRAWGGLGEKNGSGLLRRKPDPFS